MGYHGFGMRKEVYTRKPKKAFAKIKKHNVKNPYSSPEKRDDREAYIHTYHKPASKRWWFIILAIAAIVLIPYTYFSTFVWPAERLEQQVVAFENGGILDYYMNHKASFDSVYTFMQSTDGAINYIGRNLYSSRVELSIMSRDKGDGRKSYFFNPDKEDHVDYRIENEILKYYRFDGLEVKREHWELNIEIQNIAQLDPSFVKHLGVSQQQLDYYLRRCYAQRWEIHDYSSGVVWHFRKYDDFYKIYFPAPGTKLTESQKREMKELAPSIYWQ